MSHLKKGAPLLLIFFLGLGLASYGQVAPDPLPEPAVLSTPDVPLGPPMPEEPAALPVDHSTATPREARAVPLAPTDNAASLKSEAPRWHFRVRLETTLTYDDNIFIQATGRQSDFYFGITPLVAIGWGKFRADSSIVTGGSSRFPQVAARDDNGNSFTLRYAPNAQIFFDHSDQNALNQDVNLGGRWVTGKVSLEMQARFQKLTAPDIDVGNRISNTVTSGLFNANYQMTEKTSLDSRFALQHDSYQGGLDSTDLTIASLLNYRLWPKTTVGAGVGVGYTTVQQGSEQYYEQGLCHVRYEPTAKLSFEVTAGIEDRQTANGPDRITPIFEFSANYDLQEATSLRLSASRRTETSARFSDQNLQRTTVEGSVRQRFFQKVYLTLNAGYEHVTYVDAGASANRDDDYTYFGIESAIELTRWVSLRASYRHQNDDSSGSEFSFRRNVAELQVNLQF